MALRSTELEKTIPLLLIENAISWADKRWEYELDYLNTLLSKYPDEVYEPIKEWVKEHLITSCRKGYLEGVMKGAAYIQNWNEEKEQTKSEYRQHGVR